MSTITIPASRYISDKIQRLWSLSTLARHLNLSIAKHEVLKNKVIGLDNIQRRLLILKKINDKPECWMIDLKDLQSCSVKKIYNSISAGSLKRKKLDEFLNTISLHLGFKSAKEPVILKFYQDKYNDLTELQILETKAKKWANIVSGLLPKATEERAELQNKLCRKLSI